MLQFFATNRSLDRLGRALPKPEQESSDKRRLLSKGGYYFVDMATYMKHYLGTTDADEMPAAAVVTESKSDVFEKFLDDKRISSITLCIHGFNVELFEAATWYRVLADTMKHLPGVGAKIVTSLDDLSAKQSTDSDLMAFIGFSWPSNGNVLSYMSDQRDAVGSSAALAELLVRLRATGKTVNLICHSMGNYVACHTLAALVNEVVFPPSARDDKKVAAMLQRGPRLEGGDGEQIERNDWLVDTFVMIAPDVERRHVTKCADPAFETSYVGPFYSGLQHLVRKKVNVYSRFDGALAVSNIEKKPREAALAVGDGLSSLTFGLLDFLERNPDQMWEKRLGEAPAPVNAAPGFVSINATELANRKIDHGDHIDATPVVGRIAEELIG